MRRNERQVILKQVLPHTLKDVLGLIVGYLDNYPRSLFCWSFRLGDLSGNARKRVFYASLQSWNPAATNSVNATANAENATRANSANALTSTDANTFTERHTVISDAKQITSRSLVVVDEDEKRMWVFGEKKIMYRDADDSCDLKLSLQHPVCEFGARCRMHNSIYFLYERTSWGELLFSRYNLQKNEWTTLTPPRIPGRMFQTDGSHLLVLDGFDSSRYLFHLNDYWHQYNDSPFLHRYNPSLDSWNSTDIVTLGSMSTAKAPTTSTDQLVPKVMMNVVDVKTGLYDRQKYACVKYGERSFLVIGGTRRDQLANKPIVDCSIVVLDEEGKNATISEFAPLKFSSYQPIVNRLSDTIYVAFSGDQVVIQRLDESIAKPEWTIVHSSNAHHNLHFCKTL